MFTHRLAPCKINFIKPIILVANCFPFKCDRLTVKIVCSFSHGQRESIVSRMYLHLCIVFLGIVIVNAQCPTTTLVSPGPPKCSDYPNGYFINDFSNCQAYYFCPNILSPPYPGKCLAPYNFDQTHQMCNHPENYACPSIQCVAEAEYTKVAVDYHNQYRSHHGAPKVTARSSDINQYAQNWADYLSKTDKFYHSGGPYGENLFKVYGGSTDPSTIMANAIKTFYNEIKFYDWNNPVFSMKTGHFTQVVWKSSIEIGVGIATYPDQRYTHRTVVCISYRPPGNVQGQFRQNVLPPKVSLDFIRNIWNSTTIRNEYDKPIETMVL